MTGCSLGQILREDFDRLARSQGLPLRVHRAARLMMKCRTSELGGHVQCCRNGHVVGVHYNSCRHRSCPQCSHRDQSRWSELQAGRLLACDHYHVIFTLPHEFNELWSWNRSLMMDMLFAAASQAMNELLSDPRFLGARPGMLLSLHTWGRTLSRHPHVHALVSAGGLDASGQWRSCRPDYLVPIQALKPVYRGKFLNSMEQALSNGQLQLPNGMSVSQAQALLKEVSRKTWNIRIQTKYSHGRGVMQYLARYVRGGPIKNQQLRHVDSSGVSFSYSDHRDQHKKSMTLTREEFIQRVFWHVPVRGKHTTRYYGLYRPQEKLNREHCRRLLRQRPEPAPPPRPSWQEWLQQKGLGKLARCKQCGAEILAQAAKPTEESDRTMSIAPGPQSTFVQSGKGGCLARPPHNTLHAGPHRAFHLEW